MIVIVMIIMIIMIMVMIIIIMIIMIMIVLKHWLRAHASPGLTSTHGTACTYVKTRRCTP